jgi:hypothetical protein
MTLADLLPISSQVSLRPATLDTTTSPLLSKPCANVSYSPQLLSLMGQNTHHDFHAHRAGAAALHLVLVAEQVDARLPPPVVQAALDQHAQHSALARVHIAHDGDARLDDVVDARGPPPQHQLPARARVLRVAGADLDRGIGPHVPRHEQRAVGPGRVARGAHPLQREVPVRHGEAHGVAAVLEAEVEEGLAVALDQAGLDVLGQLGGIVVVRVEQQRLERERGRRVVGQTELVEDAQLVVLVGGGGRVAGRAAQRLLPLHVVGEVAQGLRVSVAPADTADAGALTLSPLRRSMGLCLGACREVMAGVVCCGRSCREQLVFRCSCVVFARVLLFVRDVNVP